MILQATMPGSLLAVDFKKIIGLPANNQRTPITSITNVIKDDAGNELIDIDNTDSLEVETYQELIKTKQQENRPYIIARVVSLLTNDILTNPIFGVHYFGAHALNDWLFKKFINEFRQLFTYQNPANNMPITELDYFAINNVNDAAFTHTCSFNDLTNNPRTWIAHFEINQPMVLSYIDKLQLGLHLIQGTGGKVQNIPLAISLLEEVANQQRDDVPAAILANAALGHIYFDGLGIPIHYRKARQHFQTVTANPNVNPYQTACAHAMLGLIYFDGLDVSSNYRRARQHFEQVTAIPNINPHQTAFAKAMLGLISYKQDDSATANQRFLEVIANPNLNPRATAIARSTLGLMYCNGDDVPQNYTTARQYFEQVILRPNDDHNSTIVSCMQLGYLYFYGAGVVKNIEIARFYFELVVQMSRIQMSRNSNQVSLAQLMLNQIGE